jgi:uroporphyrinogen decarboxylase
MNTLFLDALHCRNRERPPIWLMRQAGRYMPEYRELRKKHTFLDLCHQPEMIAQVTQLPIRSFGMDAAILFSDILLIPEALGVGLQFHDATGPIIERPLEKPEDISALPRIEIKESLSFVAQGIQLLKGQLGVPLIGFAGAPFTLASYMIEGKTSRTFRKTKQWMFSNSESFHQLLELLSECVISSLEMQIESGVNAVQIFDSWAGTLAYPQFCEFSLAYLKKIINRLARKSPSIVFCKGASVFASELASIHPNGISFDWNVNLSSLRPMIPSNIAIQGNLDPDVLYASRSVICSQAAKLLHGMRNDPGYIFNLGHGITPETPIESVKALVETVQNYHQRVH